MARCSAGNVTVSTVLGLLLGSASVALAQQRDMRIALGSDVVCRGRAERGAPVVTSLRLGDPFNTNRVVSDPANAVWYEVADMRVPCFVFGALTARFDGYDNPDAALAAIANHALALETKATFQHLVAVDNLLLERKRRNGRFFQSPAEMPPLLTTRQLQVIDRAARTVSRRQVAQDPLVMAWLLAHADLVRYFEPGGGYIVLGSHFWEIYERYQTSPAAEEIAWVAAEVPVPADECYTECHLDALAETYMRYWRRFPDGPHVLEAVTHGVRRAQHAARYCPLIAGNHVDGSPNRIRTLVSGVRDSLQQVMLAEKNDLSRYLSEIESICTGNALDLKNRSAIPYLVKALGSGFTMVPQQLAAFGEDAAPAVLDVVMSAQSYRYAIADGLWALRLMVERAAPDVLSAATRGRMREAAEYWVARPDSVAMRRAAADLAAALSRIQ
jgi:hypothetical protein